MHKQSRMKSKPKFMYGWLRIFLWYNWRYLHINFKLDSDDNNRKLCRDKYLPSWYIPIIPLIFRVCAKQKVEAKHFENCHLVTQIRFFNYFFPITKLKL